MLVPRRDKYFKSCPSETKQTEEMVYRIELKFLTLNFFENFILDLCPGCRIFLAEEVVRGKLKLSKVVRYSAKLAVHVAGG